VDDYHITSRSVNFDVFEGEFDFAAAPLFEMSDGACSLQEINLKLGCLVANVLVHIGEVDP